MSESPRMRGKRQLIQIGFHVCTLTRYERAQTRGCFDLRDAGDNSMVKVIDPTGKIHYAPALYFEEITQDKKHHHQLRQDIKKSQSR